jgi:hypothetical protein
MASKKPKGWKQPRTSPLIVRDKYGRKRPIGISDNLGNLNRLFKAQRQMKRAANG